MRFLKDVVPYLARYKAKLSLGLGLIVLGTLFQLVTPILLYKAVDALESPDSGTERFIFYLFLAIVSFAVLRSVFQFFGRYILISTSRFIEYDLRNDVFAHLQKLPPSFYDAHLTGDITSRVINDIEGVRMMAGMALMALTSISLVFAFCITIMFVMDPRLAALSLTPLVLISLVAYFFNRNIHRRSLQVQEQLAAISTKAHENFSGIRVIKTFAQEKGEMEHFERLCADYRRKNVSLATWQNSMSALFTILIEIGLVITLLVGGAGLFDGTFTKAKLTAFAAYQFMLIWPMIAFGWILNLVQRGNACMERISQILKTPAAEGPLPAPSAPVSLSKRPDLSIRNLSFSYDRGRTWALRDIDLSIPFGTRLAIVGHTGSGKTTLTRLLLKLYPVPEQTIFIGGRDIQTLSARDLRGMMGVALQDSFLFSDTVRDNTAFGTPDATPAWLEKTVQMAMLSSEIEAMPQRFDQIIGERGLTLSGGQKQRVSLARAIMKDAPVLILDDPFSSVDVETESKIMESLRPHLKDKTFILITHRLSSARMMDQIVVMDQGRIVERGVHDDLLRSGGLYSVLVEKQRILTELNGV